MSVTWRIDAQTAAGGSDDMATPLWLAGAPWCDLNCPHRGAMSCKLTGRPERLCEPVIRQMAAMLSAGPVRT